MSVQFFALTVGSTFLKEKRKLKSFIDFIFRNEKKRLKSLTYVFCSDEYLLKINQDFLNHDFYTDIITFDLNSSGEEIEGEVYISIDRVKDNAGKLGVVFITELHRVIFHGVLHLCGYKDKSSNERAKMRAKEDKYLELYFK